MGLKTLYLTIIAVSVLAWFQFIYLVMPLYLQRISFHKPLVSASPVDNYLIKKAIEKLRAIDFDTEMSTCDKCKQRLMVGKNVSATREDLIPTIFTKWCEGSHVLDDSWCKTIFKRNTLQRSSFGSNFADLVSLMDPMSYDGDCFCHTVFKGQCPYVSPPKIDVSYMWGGKEKDEKYKVASEPGKEVFNVLHISDFHIQLDYTVGSESNCTSNMCCTPHSTNLVPVPEGYKFSDSLGYNESDFSLYNSSYIDGVFNKGEWTGAKNTSWSPAFTFGNYYCDAPEVLVNSSLDSIIEFQKDQNLSFEFAIFTGDLIDHDEMKYITYESTVLSEEIIFRDLKFKLQDIPLYPVLGNHDSFPYAQQAQQKYGLSNMFDWNVNLMSDLWHDYRWLDSKHHKQAREHYTGYSVDSPAGLRVIALNSNPWYVSNFYAYINMTGDPDSFGQFQFLVDELLDAEANDKRVWLTMHVPAGVDMIPTASEILAQIIERFSPYTIAGIFNGHTHRDEFKMLYSNKEISLENAVAHTWIAPSITSWPKLNPSFRFLEIDTKTFSVMNAYTYYTMLNETFVSNGSEPIWELEYDARKDYKIKDWPESSPLNATYWHHVAQKMNQSEETLQTYENYATRFSPYTFNCSQDNSCSEFWCYVTSFTMDSYIECIGQ
ncbi:hypothetical protein CANARDRAFT_27073 [[Candida] arabinofermentans NRRL YB-2248]|uniref:Uncharacterized protein n=1 Tax=[Candida] arabinofermentans NRRL YB-2248 TaxID=983967 RepID=A0A1E4T4F4_9ASCO|nr:hypothetical protein CANARDRAFT_27073 [[Candida] arabinofermentans NRRL YB-2248]